MYLLSCDCSMMICHGFELTHLIYLHILSLMKLVIEARICMKKLTVDGHGESARWIGWRDELYWAAQLPTWMDKMHEEIDCRLS